MIYAFFFLSLTVPGFVLAVRTLPWVDAKVLAGVKPWACDVCSCFWSTLLWSPVVYYWGLEALLAAPPAYTVALALLGVLSRPPPLPPVLG